MLDEVFLSQEIERLLPDVDEQGREAVVSLAAAECGFLEHLAIEQQQILDDQRGIIKWLECDMRHCQQTLKRYAGCRKALWASVSLNAALLVGIFLYWSQR